MRRRAKRCLALADSPLPAGRPAHPPTGILPRGPGHPTPTRSRKCPSTLFHKWSPKSTNVYSTNLPEAPICARQGAKHLHTPGECKPRLWVRGLGSIPSSGPFLTVWSQTVLTFPGLTFCLCKTGIIMGSTPPKVLVRIKCFGQRIDAFGLWCWRRLLRVPWTARRSNQFILKEISPEYSLEGLMLKLQ